MIVFTDTDGNAIGNYTMQMHPGDVKEFNMLVPCIENRSLRASVVSNLTVEGRKTGDPDYVDLETTPIDTTAFAPLYTLFDLRLTAGPLKQTQSFDLTVE